ncbi:Iwr1p NDAI_0B03350 [Naumovozyma dairenensis CBS 421]|uniref:Transcription factor Iwr1 domain-containing protein n=1 Tax=Naumovozyma dairenensis (strain ATCC 10597 / BCRC 20456 / CBS 421 / NBRC 0211 / NRRL Y-12639) TaxID=1071378 RepID=G0W6F8_NAUDC|nr:hypothetical protein NDAI_0B03350 [Naumovozyma dairenensis CBS 421]CCD23369.1 hypothetical protein NDAI_0B03350 [Naumovozyma dairenensis CBS 421]
MTLNNSTIPSSDAPEFIRVKRRRDEDSVQALLIDEGKKNKRTKFMFRLTKTVNPNSYQSEHESTTPLLKLSATDNRHFVLEQKKRRHSSTYDGDEKPLPYTDQDRATTTNDDNELPPEIHEMVDKYLTLNKGKPTTTRKKPSKKHFTGESAKIITMPSLDYVYDIYHLENLPDEEEISKYKRDNKIGFVKIINTDMDLVPDEDEDEDVLARSDDEDSNEENYYQNDYPEDEDDDRSVLFGSEGEDIAADGEGPMTQNEPWNYQKILRADGTENVEDEYADLFDKLGGNNNILSSINPGSNFVDLDRGADIEETHDSDEAEEDIDVDYNELDHDNSLMTDYGKGNFPRNRFFPTDDEDPLAEHRDKIFGNLQNMINKK